MRIERVSGLANVILRGNTVIMDFITPTGEHIKRYHRFKTRQKAVKYYQTFSMNHNHYEIVLTCPNCGEVVEKDVELSTNLYHCPNCDHDYYETQLVEKAI